MWQYVSDLAAQSGHDVSVVPSEIKAVISGLLILSGVLENEELISVNLMTTEKKRYLHCEVSVRVHSAAS